MIVCAAIYAQFAWALGQPLSYGPALLTRLRLTEAPRDSPVLRELRSADREYAAAVDLTRDAEHRQRLEQQRLRLAAELAPLRSAQAAANRAGWWQFASVAIALAGLWALRRLTV